MESQHDKGVVIPAGHNQPDLPNLELILKRQWTGAMGKESPSPVGAYLGQIMEEQDPGAIKEL